MKIAAVLHVSLLVSDLDESLRFYVDTLGLNPDTGRPDLDFPGAWFQLGDQQLHLLRLANPDPTENT